MWKWRMKPIRTRHRFTSKSHSIPGIAACVMELLLLLLYLFMVSRAYTDPGQLSLYEGSLGILALLLSVVALYLAVRSEKDENAFKLFPHLALAGAILLLLLWGGTYLIGMMA